MKNFKGLFVYSLSNLLERFAFYALMSVIVVSLMEKFGLSNEKTGIYYSVFYFSIYIYILIMAVIGDFFNRRKIIYFGLITLSIGYLLYSIMPVSSGFLIIIPLILVSLGVGAFKPNLLVQVGDLYKNDIKSGAVGLLIFTTFLNLGAVIAPFGSIYLKNKYGIDSVFLLSFVLIVLAFALYYFFPVSSETESENTNSDRNNYSNDKLLSLVFLIIIVPVFWMAFHQNGLVYTFFIKDFVETGANSYEHIQALNPLVIVVFSLLFALLIFLFFKIKNKFNLLPIIGVGMLIATVGYYFPYYFLENTTGKLPYDNAVLPMVVISVAEVIILPFIILGFYHFSPQRLKGLFLGVFMAASAVGNQLLFLYGNNYEIFGASDTFKKITIHILICAAAVFLFFFIIKKLNFKSHPLKK